MSNYPIELLAPAKNLDAAKAAIDYGADAIYMGATNYGARRAASNSIDDIAKAVEYAHRFGARVHIALNTLLFDDELADAETTARRLIDVGIDALIVQDMALRAMNLPVEMHASTQVYNATAEGVRFLEQCGFARVILERALTLDQIHAIRQNSNVELECFIHGAICVGHSGRCFLSRTTSSRSGNRGECSQPCRLPYDLTDSTGRKIISGKHLLSVRDLDLSESLEELILAGVSSFKIEGRLKDERYIKNIVSHYRLLLDRILARHTEFSRASIGESTPDFTPNPAKSFTRGASEYMLYGKRPDVASFDTPKSVGEYIGRIETVTQRGFRLDSSATLSAGDGICIVGKDGLSGTNINSVENGIITPNRTEGVEPGNKVYRNYDHRFTLALERSKTRRAIATTAHLVLSAQGATLSVSDCDGVNAVAMRKIELQVATNPEKMEQTARRQIEKSGNTIFSITDIEILGAEYFAPASLISDLRREALDVLLVERLKRPIPHNIIADEYTALYPRKKITRHENVTNHMAEEFYRRHGVEEIEPALELNPTIGEKVMQSSYCIRREIGQCLKEKPSLKGDLFIEHGNTKYALKFDCKLCQMELWHLS